MQSPESHQRPLINSTDTSYQSISVGIAAIPHQQPRRNNNSAGTDDDKYYKASKAKRTALWNNLCSKPLSFMIAASVLLLLLFGNLSTTSGDDSSNSSSSSNIFGINTTAGRENNTNASAQTIVFNDRFGRPVTVVHQPTPVPVKPVVTAQTIVNNNSERRNSTALEDRKQAVIRAFQHSWTGYKQFAFGKDHLHPVSHTGTDWFGMGLTLLDGMDTAYLMGLNQIVDESRLYVRERLKFNHRSHSNVFEVTIRVLGSLLSMHHLTGDELYLSRAQELADKMLPAFNTPNGVPLASLDFSTGAAVAAPDLGSSTSEATTLQLEWRYLAVLTGETKYWRAAERVMDSIAKSTPASGRVDGLVPIYISTTGDQDHLFVGTNYRLGSRGDSYYEYLAKQWLQTGRAEDRYRQMFEQAMDGMLKRLRTRSRPSGWEFIGELQHGIDGGLTPKMDHLVCFLPGTLALFVSHGKRLSAQEISKLPEKHREYLRFAQSLLETCYQTYRVTATGLAPEIVYFNMNDNGGSEDIIIHNMDGHNILRPETVESLFYLYRITGNQTYRQWGWEMFQNFEKHCKVPDGGYSSLRDVRQSPPEMSDKMESFWVGETLKYFYLLFDDDAKLPLDKYLINTEAHPLPILDEIPAEFLKKLQAEGLGRFAPR